MKQNQADCVADKSMSCMDSQNTERNRENWPDTEREGNEGYDSKTPMNQSRRKSVKFGADESQELPENQEWAEI